MKKTQGNKLLNISLPKEEKKDILEKIKKFIIKPDQFLHIVSLNSENLVIAQKNEKFKKVINKAQIKIIDGIGVILAAQILNLRVGQRYPGVDLMSDLIKFARKKRLKVLLIGGQSKIANRLANCYQRQYPQAKFIGVEGIKNIKKPEKTEENKIFSIVSDFKPHFIFVAFGSPEQELWIERNKDHFKKCLVMGVGGGFDFLSGKVRRAPLVIRKLGMEWLFRLIVQPWRWRRQLRLVEFIFLVIKQKIKETIFKS